MTSIIFDEVPQELAACEACGGEGHTIHRITVYEHGCGFPHDDIDERPCEACGGLGEFVRDMEGDRAGTCDVCDRRDVSLSRAFAAGIETFHCEECGS